MTNKKILEMIENVDLPISKEDMEALAAFKSKYPTWWFTIGVCDLTRDFTCAPQAHSPEAAYIKSAGDCWDAGFSCDSEGTIADAIYDVMEQIEKEELCLSASQ